jgi:hypothetical protein
MKKQQFIPTLNSLKQEFGIQKLNTGKQFNYRGIIFDDSEGLHALVGPDDCVHFRSGTEMSSVSYRGQTEDFGMCITTLDRCTTQEEQILSMCRTIAFEDILQTHPFIEVSKKNLFFDKSICINDTGIAQHYGLDTNYLDITANFDVASFFATCKWCNDLKKYLPLSYTQKPDVIYRVYDFLVNPLIAENTQKRSFSYLGWQPLPRPEQQRANVIKLDKGQDFETVSGVKKYYFKHSKSASKKIYKMFDEGKTLFPEDSGVQLSQDCENLLKFTNEQIDKAFMRYESWSNIELTEEYKKETIKKLEIQIIENIAHSWDEFLDTDMKIWEDKLSEIFQKVRCRMTC